MRIQKSSGARPSLNFFSLLVIHALNGKSRNECFENFQLSFDFEIIDTKP